jgi:predicted phosphohydrolase
MAHPCTAHFSSFNDMTMRIVLISDTHNRHDGIQLPEGDILIHSGDFSGRGLEREVIDFLHWFGKQPHRHKVLIAGNHDFLAEKNPGLFASLIPEGVTYLNDSGAVIEGLKIWGSPIQPWFYDWAFNRQRGADIARHWELIPADTDILVTHGPPFGILDKVENGPHVGCEELLKKIESVQPRLHVFGHIHEGHGELQVGKTKFVNASVLNAKYMLVWDATEVELG